MDRVCIKCELSKSMDEFYKNGRFYKTICKECDKKKSELYRKENYERVTTSNREFGRVNREKRSEYSKKRYAIKRDEILKQQKEYWSKPENKARKALRKREQWLKDANLRIASACRCRIFKSLKGQKKSKATEKLVGCSFSELKKCLESKFLDGMDWNNYGVWHIDHILPCASFDLSKQEAQEKCFHYTNLQPLWGIDNLLKRDKIL